MTKTKLTVILLSVFLIAGAFICGYPLQKTTAYADGIVVDVNTAEDMVALSNEVAGGENKLGVTFNLTADLDLTEIEYSPIGTSSVLFQGTFNGNGHKINVSINQASGSTGLFGCVGSGGSITSLTVTGEIRGFSAVGGIVGSNDGAIIDCISLANVYSDGTETSRKAGGIVGENRGKITSCVNLGTVYGSSNVGGIAGNNLNSAEINGCVSLGDIDGNGATAISAMGGIVGRSQSTVKNNYFYANFNLGSATVSNVGVMVGYLNGLGGSINNYGIDGAYNAVGGATVSAYENKFCKKTLYNVLCDEGILFEDGLFRRVKYVQGYGYLYVPAFMAKTEVDGYVFSAEYAYLSDNFKSSLFNCGDGSIDAPFVISSTENWDLFSSNISLFGYSGVRIELSDNLTLGNINPLSSAVVKFAGYFNGNGHTLTFSISGGNYSALFSHLDGADVKNLDLSGSIVGSAYSAGLVGNVGENGVRIENVTNRCSVKGTNYVGGIIGKTNDFAVVTLLNCKNYGAIEGNNNVGGLVGSLEGNLSVDGLSNYGMITSKVNGATNVGGVIGNLNTASQNDKTFLSLHNGGVISATKATGVGGIIGKTNASTTTYSLTITGLSNTADITGRYNVGGLIGNAVKALTISDFMAIATIKAVNKVGGIACSVESITLNRGYFVGKFIEDTTVSKEGGFKTDETVYGECVVTDVYYNGDVSANTNEHGATKLNSVQMSDGSLFAKTPLWTNVDKEINSGKYPVVNSEKIINGSVLDVYYFSGMRPGVEVVYLIGTEQALRNFSYLCNNYDDYSGFSYQLTKDIELKSAFNSISTFSGSFDGNGYVLKNINISASGSHGGLFETLSAGATVSDLGIIGGTLTLTDGTVGGIAGKAVSGVSITKCYADMVLSGNTVGGIVGDNAGTVENCFFAGSANGDTIGGLAAVNSGTVSNSFCSGIIVADTLCGGIVATNNGGTVTHCYTSGRVEAASVGGLCGVADASSIFTDCYVIADVVGTSKAGLAASIIVGETTITNCYYNSSTISVTAYPGAVNNTLYQKTSENLRSTNFSIDGYGRQISTYNADYDSYFAPHLLSTAEWSEQSALVADYLQKSVELHVFGNDSASFAPIGSESNPYLISTANQFAMISVLTKYTSFKGKYFAVINDIDMGDSNINGGTMYAIGYFENESSTNNFYFDGTVYGKNLYSISNISIENATSKTSVLTSSYLGVFAYTGTNFAVKNLKFYGEVKGTDYIGSIVGYLMGGTIDDCYSEMRVGSSGSSNVGGLVGKATNGASITDSVFNGLVGRTTGEKYVYGIIGLPSSAVTLNTKNTWYVLDYEDYNGYVHNGYGSILYVDKNLINGGGVTIEHNNGYGFKLTANGNYRGYLMNTNNELVAEATSAYYPINGVSVAEGQSVVYFARYCLSVTVTVNGSITSSIAEARVAGIGYYFVGQNVLSTISWKQNVDGYKLSGIEDSVGQLNCTLTNTADDVNVGFVMTETTTTLNFIVEEMTSNNGGDIITFTQPTNTPYGGDERVDAVNLDGYSVEYFLEDGTARDALKNAGAYSVRIKEINANGIIIGRKIVNYAIAKKSISVDFTKNFSAYTKKVYDGKATDSITVSTETEGIKDFFVGIVGEENIVAEFTVLYSGVNVGQNLNVTLKDFTVKGESEINYYFTADDHSLGAVGEITKQTMLITITQAVLKNNKYMMSQDFSGEKPIIAGTYPLSLVWSFAKLNADYTADTAWTEAKGYNVGVYAVSVAAISEIDRNNYNIVLANEYYMEIISYKVTNVNYSHTENLVYNGTRLSSSISAYYVGVDGNNYSVTLSYYKAATVTNGNDVAENIYYEIVDEKLVLTQDEKFNGAKIYYVAVGEIENAGSYCAVAKGNSDNYSVDVNVKRITVARSEFGGNIVYSLNSGAIVDGGAVSIGDEIILTFTDTVSASEGYDAKYLIEISDTARGNFAVTKVGETFYLTPIEYGNSVKFRIVATNSTNYEDRYSAYVTLNVKPATLYVGLSNTKFDNGEKKTEFIYGNTVDFDLVYYTDNDRSNAMGKETIAGLRAPEIHTSTATYNVGEYTLIYSGGESDGYVFEFLDTTVTVVRRDIILVASVVCSKTYGDTEENITYTLAEVVEGQRIALSKLPNGLAVNLTGKLARTGGENVGDYVVNAGTITNQNNPNYNITYDITAKFEIRQRGIKFVVKTGQGKEYGEADGRIEMVADEGYSLINDVNLGIYDTVDMFYSVVILSRAEGEKAGQYSYIVDVKSDVALNYKILAVSIGDNNKYTIYRATPRVDFELTGTAYFGDEVSSLQYSAIATKGTTKIDGRYELSGKTATLQMTDTTIKVRFIPDDDNYSAVLVSDVDVNVQKRPVTVSIYTNDNGENALADGVYFTYTGYGIAASNFTYVVNNTVEDDTSYTVTLELDGDNKNVTTNGFTVKASLVSDKYVLLIQPTVTCYISKATLNVSIKNGEIKQGDSFTAVISYSGFVAGENESVLTKKATVANMPTTVGYHSLVASGAEAKNYTFDYLGGILIVSPKQMNADGVTIDGDFSPNTKLTVNKPEVGSGAFIAESEKLEKALGASYFKPLNYNLAEFAEIRCDSEQTEDCRYKIKLSTVIGESNKIYVCYADGTVGEVEYTEETSDEGTVITFQAKNVTGIAVYTKKGWLDLIKGYYVYAIVIVIAFVLIVSIAVICVTKHNKKKAIVKFARRANWR